MSEPTTSEMLAEIRTIALSWKAALVQIVECGSIKEAERIAMKALSDAAGAK